jgi:hypothetical protein
MGGRAVGRCVAWMWSRDGVVARVRVPGRHGPPSRGPHLSDLHAGPEALVTGRPPRASGRLRPDLQAFGRESDTLTWRSPLASDQRFRWSARRILRAALGAGGRRLKSGRPDHQQPRSTALPRRPARAATLSAAVSRHQAARPGAPAAAWTTGADYLALADATLLLDGLQVVSDERAASQAVAGTLPGRNLQRAVLLSDRRQPAGRPVRAGHLGAAAGPAGREWAGGAAAPGPRRRGRRRRGSAVAPDQAQRRCHRRLRRT